MDCNYKRLHNVVFVLGPPGSGKGTQCAKISEEFDYLHLSAGDLLRRERSRTGSEFGQLIDKCIRNGTIVPVEITCKLLENAMLDSPKSAGFLVDGFPRNQNNLDGWRSEMDEKACLKFVLFLTCDENICTDRCLNRGEGRTDDNEQSLLRRVQTYINQTMPIIEHYEKMALVKKVDSARAPDEVYADVRMVFKNAGI